MAPCEVFGPKDQLHWLFLTANKKFLRSTKVEARYLQLFGVEMSNAGFEGEPNAIMAKYFPNEVKIEKSGKKGHNFNYRMEPTPLSKVLEKYYQIFQRLKQCMLDIVLGGDSGEMLWSKVMQEYKKQGGIEDLTCFNAIRTKAFASDGEILRAYFKNVFKISVVPGGDLILCVKKAFQTVSKKKVSSLEKCQNEKKEKETKKNTSSENARKKFKEKVCPDMGGEAKVPNEVANQDLFKSVDVEEVYSTGKKLKVTSGHLFKGKEKEEEISLSWDYKPEHYPCLVYDSNNTQNQKNCIHTDADVNDRFTIIQKEVSQRNMNFNVFDILQQLCQYYNVKSVKGIRTSKFPYGLRHEKDIGAVFNFIKLQEEVNTYIHAYCMTFGITCLYDLQQRIVKHKEIKSFEQLRLGPLHRFPLVYKYFKFPFDADIPVIKIEDVMSGLWRFRGTVKQKGAKMVDKDEFLNDLAAKHGLKSRYHLGVDIKSMGILISMMSKAKFGFLEKRKAMENQMQQEMENELDRKLLKIRHAWAGRNQMALPGTATNLIAQMEGVSIEKAILEIFNFACQLKEDCVKDAVKSGFWGPAQKIVECMIVIRQNPLFVKMFHLIVARGLFQQLGKDDVSLLHFLGLDKALEALLQEREQAAPTQKKTTAKDGLRVTQNIKTGHILKKCRSYFEQCDDVIDLCTLANLEMDIARSCHEDADTFPDLGQGTFLQFLNENPELLRAFGSHIAINASKVPLKLPGHVSAIDTREFVGQCHGLLKAEEIHKSFCDQFDLDKTLASVWSELDVAVKAKTNHVSERQTPVVLYHHALLLGTRANSCEKAEESQDFVYEDSVSWGSQEDAVQCLLSTPMLEDVARWTHWDVIFKQKCGALKLFLRHMHKDNRFGDSQFQVLEVQQGVLLRVLPQATCDDFRHCLASSCPDPEWAAALLVSIICNSGGVQQAPLALMANIFQSTLHDLARQYGDGQPEQSLSPLRFVLQCISRIPVKLASYMLQKMFLFPLEQIYGKGDLYAQLLAACSSRVEKGYLHQLGVLHAIQVWIEDFKKTMTKFDTPNSQEEARDEDVATAESPVVCPDDCNSNSLNKVIELEERKLAAVQFSGTSDTGKEGWDDQLDEEFLFGEVDSIDVRDDLTESSCKQVIEDIRRHEFGIGENLDERATRLMQAHNARLGRSLERLSTELYSKDTHFVLELIQNADDNKYAEKLLKGQKEQRPSIAFLIEKDSVSMHNNELGFTEENVRAICDVGKTTKGVHRKGYIGQKGIGFKSIFRVTDCPEVHSNGYHIRFDAREGSVGYILPQWIEDHKEEDLNLIQTSGIEVDWTTQIVLPLKRTIIDSPNSLSARFHDIHPSLLLFLNRLQVIIIDDKVKNRFSLMKKRLLENDLIELSSGGIPSLWLVFNQEIPIEVRPDIPTTDISLAFPIDDASHVSLNEQSLPAQPVFAYLPLRSYGFKFVIQADFEVPSSREDIDRDSPWNQWILEKLPSLVVKAFYKFKAHPSFNPLTGAARFFRFMTLEEEVLGSFRPTAGRIIKLLQAEKCIPVESPLLETEGGSGKIEWVIPSSALLQDPTLKSIVSSAELKKFLNLHYMVEEVQKQIPTSLLSALGVRSPNLNHLIDILKERLALEASNKESVAVEETAAWVGRWLLCVTQYLEAQHDCSRQSLSQIQELPVFPLADGTLVSLDKESVFFPTDQKQSSTKWMALLDKDLRTLSSHIFDGLDSVGAHRVEHFFDRLGVRRRGIREVIVHHIVPTMKSNAWKDKSSDLLIAYVKLVHKQWREDPDGIDLNELKSCLVLSTSQGFIRSTDVAIYFSKEFGNTVDYKELYPEIKWNILSNKYLDKEKDLKSWQTFFSALGVNYFFAIKRKTTELYYMEMENSVWAQYFKDWPVPKDSLYVIDDYYSRDLESILTSPIEKSCRALLRHLNAGWEKFLKPLELESKTAIVRDGYGNQLATTYSALTILLKGKAWVPGSLNEEVALYKPGDLFRNTEAIRKVLRQFCPYLDLELNEQSFVDFLGVKQKVSPELLFSFLRKWINEAQFSTSLDHMESVYTELQRVGQKYLENIIEERFIFISDNNGDTSSCLPGEFLAREKVRWKDPSGVVTGKRELFGSRFCLLENCYPESLRDFFCKCAHVQETPTIRDYLEISETLSENVVLPDVDAINDLQAIYAVIGQQCIKERERKTVHCLFDEGCSFQEDYESLDSIIEANNGRFLYENIKELSVFPTKQAKMVSLEKMPLLADDEEYESIFREENDVLFLDLGSLNHSLHNLLTKRPQRRRKGDSPPDLKARDRLISLLVFFRACHVHTVSSVVLPPRPQSEGSEVGCRTWHVQFIDVLILIQRLLFHRYPELYEQVEECNLPDYLANAQFYTCKNLDVIHRLKGFDSVEVPQSTSLAWEFVESEVECAIVKKVFLYIKESQIDDKDDIINCFLGLFVAKDEREFEYIASSITHWHSLKKSEREKALNRKEIYDLPESEKQWILPSLEKEALRPRPLKKVTSAESEHKLSDDMEGKHGANQTEVPPPPPELLTQQLALRCHSEDTQGYVRNEGEIPPPHPRHRGEPVKKTQLGVEIPVLRFNENVPPSVDNASLKASKVEHGSKIRRQEDESSLDIKHAVTKDTQAQAGMDAQPLQDTLKHQMDTLAAVKCDSNGKEEREVNGLKSKEQEGERLSKGTKDVITVSPLQFKEKSQYQPILAIECEEVSMATMCQDGDISNLIEKLPSDSDVETGWLGEYIVYCYLRMEHSDALNESRVEISWRNETQESGLPYDIQLIWLNEQKKQTAVVYIEVKATTTGQKKGFEISKAEIEFALNKGETYHLYRIYGLSNPNLVKLKKLEGFTQFLDSKTVQLYVLV